MDKFKPDEIVTDHDPLVGRFFHTLNHQEGKHILSHQGHVIGKIMDGYYLVQYYSWLSGGATNQAICQIEEMAQWMFYEDNEAMDFSYQQGVAYKYRGDKD